MPDPLAPDDIRALRQAHGWTQLELAAHLIDATPEEIDRFRDFYATFRRVLLWEAGRQSPDRANTANLRRLTPR